MGPVNWLAVFLGAVAFFATGAVWYSVLFGKAWQREAGMTEEWEAIVEKFLPCITDSKSSQMEFVADVSYPGAGG